MLSTTSNVPQRNRYDVVVVGASFAGLSFASVAATRGLRTLVLERDPIVGGVVRTTGILFSDVFDILEVPERYLMNAVRRLRIRASDTDAVAAFDSPAYRFYLADVTGLLQWLAEQAQGHGADVICGATFQSATRDHDGTMRLTYRHVDADGTARTSELSARMLIGADGAHSQVANAMDLDRNERLLAGTEWLVEGVDIERDTFYLVMDAKLAPGYCIWLSPHAEIAAFGVAGRQREFKPNESLRVAQAMFSDVTDLSKMRVVERKGGSIPIGGRLKRVYRDDMRGRALLLGDAAGLCGAATGGGIYPAIISGRLAAQAVAQELLNGSPEGVKSYLRTLPQAGRLGPYLQIEDWIRFALDRMASNADLHTLVSIMASPEGNRVVRTGLLETPIIGMDKAFFAMARGMFLQHPRLYGTAFRAAWQRLAVRA